MTTTITKQEQLYLDAKEAYYSGHEIMSDAQFDELEDELKTLGSSVIEKVGYTQLRTKVPHLFPMLSLDKIKAKEELPIKEFKNWIKKAGTNKFEFTPKYDGNAVSILYKDGVFFQALTRGNGKEGSDITDKIAKIVPSTIKNKKGTINIRGEVLIKKSLFEKYYSKDFMNSRNFVAGVLNNKEITNAVTHLTFMPYEVRLEDGTFLESISSFFLSHNFELPHFLYSTIHEYDAENEFKKMYNKFLELREKFQYQLDGIVIKVTSDYVRKKLGEGDHHPNWALAIKFPPKETIATINDISWQIGKTGEYTPIALLEPIELEGSIVSRCSLHNYRNVLDKKLFPGAKVSLFKAGDIIPQMEKVILPSPRKTYKFPTECNYCHTKLSNDGIRISCSNENCSGTLFFKFKSGINIFNIDFIGDSTIQKLFTHLRLTSPLELLDKKKVNQQTLVGAGIFQATDSKSLNRMLDSIGKIKSITLQQLFIIQGINNLGKHLSKELANMYVGLEYSTYGLEKKFFEMFKQKTPEYNKITNDITYLESLGIKVELPKKKVDTGKQTIKFEMTGNCTVDNFKTKSDFAKWLEKFGYEHSDLSKDSNLLVTDDVNSTSGKMKKASKLGIKIISYEDLYKQLN